jgi:hypothetical protein
MLCFKEFKARFHTIYATRNTHNIYVRAKQERNKITTGNTEEKQEKAEKAEVHALNTEREEETEPSSSPEKIIGTKIITRIESKSRET